MLNSKFTKSFVVALVGTAAVLSSGFVTATDVSKTPLIPTQVAKPNVIFGIDDSGSMDFEVMLNTNDGAMWWNDATVLNGVTGTGWDASGVPLYNTTGASGNGWTKLVNLFPNGCGAAMRVLCDSSNHFAIAPTYQFAWVRSSAFNPLYYNPAVNYTVWSTAYVSGATKSFSALPGTAAASHPLYATVDDLTAATALPTSTTTDLVFQMRPGMVVPAGGKIYKNNAWVLQASNYTVPSGSSYVAAISYYPATYWVPETCTVDNVSCARAPNGTVLKRYEIKSGNTFPGGRSYAAELQNFSNWYTFYRKRKLMLASSASTVLNSLTGMNIGSTDFNGNSTVTMYDTDSTDGTRNAKVVIGNFYSNTSSGGTPTRETLKYIGEQFRTNTNIVKYSCQKNAAFVMTDGFANANSVTPPAYTSATYGGSAPYTTTYAGTLADIALSYYTNTITGTGLVTGQVPASPPTATNPQNDGNPNLHVNTYAMTLGARGTLWPAVTNAYTSGVTWPNPTVDRSPTSVDDLWHATVNGRGQLFTASTPLETAQAIKAGLSNILSTSGSQAAVAFSTVNIRLDEAVGFVGSYTPVGWSGDITAYPVDITSGALMTNSPIWSANNVLMARDYTTRAIATYTGSFGTPITTAANWTALATAGKIPGTVTDFVAYLRGQRTLETSTYQTRTGLIGAVVNAEPASWLVDKVVYAASNEGMLHALDKSTGAELWAYAPKFVLADMATNATIGSSFSTILDGTPVIAKIGSKTMLVGGRGTAGSGFYGLDVTNPRGLPTGGGATTQTDTTVATRALWEFPNASTSATVASSMGTATGRPLIVNTTRWGWVAIVTSGYNNTLDGKSRVFVLNATTGAVLDTLVTPNGTLAAEAGLSQISGFQETDGTVQTLYGGDLQGNLWRFNLTASTVTRVATLTNAANATLPITAAPELTTFNNRRLINVGTGRLLGVSDFSDTTTVNTFFSIWDNGTEVNPGYAQATAATNVRKFLAMRKITVAANGNRTAVGGTLTADSKVTCVSPKTWQNGACYSGAGVDWTTQRGWYVELPIGEKANTDPTVGLGILTWTTNSPSQTTCSSSSALYMADAETGLQLPDTLFPNGAGVYGTAFSTTLTSRPVIAKLPDGKVSITTHQSDNTTRSTVLNAGANESAYLKPAKLAWKQVLQ